MNEETIGYSILASILGMGIVLLALFVFDLVMVALTRIFGEKKSGKAAAEARKNGHVSAPAAVEGAPASPASGKEDLGWLFAAVAAYLSDSEEETAPLSALSWQPNPAETCNPWILAPHVNHTWTGVR